MFLTNLADDAVMSLRATHLFQTEHSTNNENSPTAWPDRQYESSRSYKIQSDYMHDKYSYIYKSHINDRNNLHIMRLIFEIINHI